jgi:alpha-tubulin suppressor-like RCC1 family protein
MENIGDDEAPADAPPVEVGDEVDSVQVGSFHTCALLTRGAVRCWGWDAGVGALGYADGVETVGDDETPASAGDIDLGGVAVQLAVGSYHACALMEGGSLRCWGSGDEGALGYGNIEHVGDDETPAQAGDVPVGGTVVQVVAGVEETCALLEGGGVRCWGNGANALGYGNTENIGDDETPAEGGDVPL